MSPENVEIVKEFSRLFEEGDRDRWRDYFDASDTRSARLGAERSLVQIQSPRSLEGPRRKRALAIPAADRDR
jgi:hypothetical protein